MPIPFLRRHKSISEIRSFQAKKKLWYGHVLRREEECVGKCMSDGDACGERWRVRPKRRCLDNIRNDLSQREWQDRVQWTRLM